MIYLYSTAQPTISKEQFLKGERQYTAMRYFNWEDNPVIQHLNQNMINIWQNWKPDEIAEYKEKLSNRIKQLKSVVYENDPDFLNQKILGIKQQIAVFEKQKPDEQLFNTDDKDTIAHRYFTGQYNTPSNQEILNNLRNSLNDAIKHKANVEKDIKKFKELKEKLDECKDELVRINNSNLRDSPLMDMYEIVHGVSENQRNFQKSVKNIFFKLCKDYLAYKETGDPIHLKHIYKTFNAPHLFALSGDKASIDWYDKSNIIVIYPTDNKTKDKKPDLESVEYDFNNFDNKLMLSVQFPNGKGTYIPFGNPQKGNQPSNLPVDHPTFPANVAFEKISLYGNQSPSKEELQKIVSDIVKNNTILQSEFEKLYNIGNNKLELLKYWQKLSKDENDYDIAKYREQMIKNFNTTDSDAYIKLKSKEARLREINSRDYVLTYHKHIENEIKKLEKELTNTSSFDNDKKGYLRSEIRKLEARDNGKAFKEHVNAQSKILEDEIENLEKRYLKPSEKEETKSLYKKLPTATPTARADKFITPNAENVSPKLIARLLVNKYNPTIQDYKGNTYKVIVSKERLPEVFKRSTLKENFNQYTTMKEQERSILKMIKCINEGKMKTANKYLKEVVESNLKNRIKQAYKSLEK